RKVTSGYSGSALMRDLDHAVSLIEATVAATDRPVTLKMRLGWDQKSINAPELARRAEASGVRLLTVHGRTRNQFFKGEADWRAIRAVKAAVSIPVIANGDLRSVADLERAMAQSTADGVMIGRGAYGQPWLPGALVHFAATGQPGAGPVGQSWSNLVDRHYQAIIAHYGERIGVRAARKHLGWYLDRLPGAGVAADQRRALLTALQPATVMRLIGAIGAPATSLARVS
ncbi:MAG: tRNA dihydrouridine synthase, partial [Alphaproteobacteria bacterium]